MIRKTCATCAKGIADECDNFDMRPIRRCYKPTEDEIERDAAAADFAMDEARDRRMLGGEQ